MKGTSVSPAKITRPSVSGILPRQRLFRLLDAGRNRPVTWICAPAGSGKTTLVASYLDECKLPCLWYQVDRGDDDPATFFYYMGHAAKKAAPRYRKPLPLLTPEYLPGLTTFTRRYFEEIYKRVRTRGPFFIILDNYQEGSATSILHEIVREGIDIIPDRIRAIIISRAAPPEAYARLQAREKITVIDDIGLTAEETAGLMKMKAKGKVTEECVRQVFERTQGWAAGIVLMLEKARQGMIDTGSLKGTGTETIFNYFAYEIFGKVDVSTQVFLIKTSFFPDMNLQMAERLTGFQNSDQILSWLTGNNFFTERRHYNNPVYQYHPLFREFLLSQAKDHFPKNEIVELQKRTAAILEESGKAEDAFELYRGTCDWECAVRLIMTHAMKLLQAGRSGTLEGWIGGIPEEIKNNMPWLLYWIGACRLPVDPLEARRYFERAFEGFERRGEDEAGLLLSWSSVVDAIFYEQDSFVPVDRWIEWMNERIKKGLSFPSPEIEMHVSSSMAGAMTWRNPGHPDTATWIDRAMSAAQKVQDTNRYIHAVCNAVIYYMFMGYPATCISIITDTKKRVQFSSIAPINTITFNLFEACTFNTFDHYSHFMPIFSRALKFAEQNSLQVLIQQFTGQRIVASLSKGDPNETEKLLNEMMDLVSPSKRIDYSFYFWLNAWHSLRLGNMPRALSNAQTAAKLIDEVGTPFQRMLCNILITLILHESGEYEKAEKQLAVIRELLPVTGSKFSEYKYLIVKAYMEFEKAERISENPPTSPFDKGGLNASLSRRGRRVFPPLAKGGEGGFFEINALESLSKAMTLGRKQGFFGMSCLWLPRLWIRLCAKALENNIETKHVQKLIRKLELLPDERQMNNEKWHWHIRIHTFGRFGLMQDGQSLKSSGKTQKKPLEMLKVLIALGGKGVKAGHLTDALWPDSEGTWRTTRLR